MGTTSTGRPRNPSIDVEVLRTTCDHLASNGYDSMSVVAIADSAGTTRQAIYRRWPTKADLATAAIASLSTAQHRPDTDNPYADLLTELRAFRDGVGRPNGVGMVGVMLHEGTDPELVALYRQRIVAPRRARIRHILERAVDLGRADRDADIDYATASATGTYYGMHLTGRRIGKDWPERTAALVWRSIGGTLDAPR